MPGPCHRAALTAALAAGIATTAVAHEFGHLLRTLAAPLTATHRLPPPPEGDPCLETLGRQIGWLEHHLDCFGTIVAKEPDVWGQGRLTRARIEYEDEMQKQLGLFTERTSASIRRSDQAFLGMALAIQSASGSRRTPQETAVPDASGSASVINTIQGMLPTTNEAAARADAVTIARTAPFATPANPGGIRFDDEPLALEPTVHLDQLSRYLNHLNELRRVNEGDDSSDAPGYALALVRLPVSITPGGRTRKGHGAEITVIAEPCLGDDLLPTTFRSLVVNDLVDIIAPALTWAVNDHECLSWASTIVQPAASPPQRQGVMAAMQSLRAKLPAASPSMAPSLKTRRSRLPIPFSQLVDVAGVEQIAILIRDTHAALATHPETRPCIDYMQVRGLLAEELEAAYDFLAIDSHRDLWQELPEWNLATLVRGRQSRELAALRCRFFSAVGTGDEAGLELIGHEANEDAGPCCERPQPMPPICRSTTAVLAWAILVESALLNDRLITDTREAATARGHAPLHGGCAGPFFGPDPAPDARAAFASYVRTRWPIRVFALDPVRDEQNVDDAYARRRELQIAMAMASANGRLNAQAMQRYTRRLELDMATIQLNQTAVGFSHGADTFGWRFYPRVQTPPTRGGLSTLGETICGPTSDADLAQRQIEPGQRECVALVVLPAFVPWVTLDVRTSWFSLTHPKQIDPDMTQSLTLSRAVKAMHTTADACGRCTHLYRDGELARLLRVADQLERALPLQTLQAHIPHENTAGGFELFNAGITDLAPELLGWYGAPGIDPSATTSLFLIGKGFSVHDTRVVVGGKPARFRLLSREIMQVEVPAGVATVAAAPHRTDLALARTGPLVLATASEPLPEPRDAIQLPAPCDDCDASAPACLVECNRREAVELHVATPYGVTGSLMVPVERRHAGEASSLSFAASCTIGLTFAVTKATDSKAETAKVDEFFSSTCDAIAITVPRSFIPPAKAELRLLVRDTSTNETAAVFSWDNPFFDARRGGYVLAGADLRNFVGDTSRPATDKTLRGAVKPYLDALLMRGELADDGDTVTLGMAASLVSAGYEVPIGGELAVRITRRGKTIAEPTADATAEGP